MMLRVFTAFIFGMTLAIFGFTILTPQYWVLMALFIIYGGLNASSKVRE